MSPSLSRLTPALARRAAVVTVAVSMTVAVAGCGSKSKAADDGASSWADGVCSSLTTWKTSVTDAAESVTKNGVSKDSLQSAVDQAQKATSTLESDLKKLGKPNTKAGQQAKDTADQLSQLLSTNTNTIKKAIDDASGVSGLVSATATITATLLSMKTQVQGAVNNLKALDPKGELQQAFTDSASCKALASSLPTSK